MPTTNRIFIATSLDGFIADAQGQIDWLHELPNPEHNDLGYSAFMQTIDALVMGRNTFETVLGFGIDWPYSVPVFVLSNSLKTVPEELEGKVFLVNGPLEAVLGGIETRGFTQLYIDGGSTIQSFLGEDLIDEMTITTIPILLGSGISLFGELPERRKFTCTATRHMLNHVAQSDYKRIRE